MNKYYRVRVCSVRSNDPVYARHALRLSYTHTPTLCGFEREREQVEVEGVAMAGTE